MSKMGHTMPLCICTAQRLVLMMWSPHDVICRVSPVSCRYNHNQVPNPYSEGLFGNCASVWCVRIPPSKVDFRCGTLDMGVLCGVDGLV
jgi:hypothetical protein